MRSGLPSLRFLLSNISAANVVQTKTVYVFMDIPVGVLRLGERARQSKSSELEQLRQIMIEVVEIFLSTGGHTNPSLKFGRAQRGLMFAGLFTLLGSSLPANECHLNWVLNSHSLDIFPENLKYLETLKSSEVIGEVSEVRDAVVAFHQRRKEKKNAADAFVAAICDGASVTDLASLLPDIDGFCLLNGRAEKSRELHTPLDFLDPSFGMILEGANFLETAVIRDRADVVLWLASDCPSALCADWSSLPRLAQQSAKKVSSLLSSREAPVLEIVDARCRALATMRPLARIWKQHKSKTKTGSAGAKW